LVRGRKCSREVTIIFLLVPECRDFKLNTALIQICLISQNISMTVGPLVTGANRSMFDSTRWADRTTDGPFDDVDGHGLVDPMRTRAARDHYQAKLSKIAEMIRAEEIIQEGL